MCRHNKSLSLIYFMLFQYPEDLKMYVWLVYCINYIIIIGIHTFFWMKVLINIIHIFFSLTMRFYYEKGHLQNPCVFIFPRFVEILA